MAYRAVNCTDGPSKKSVLTSEDSVNAKMEATSMFCTVSEKDPVNIV